MVVKDSSRKQKPVVTPTVIQMEAVECGAASLAIILGYYGKTVPLTELRQACGVSRDGSKASNVLKASRIYGMEADGYRYELEQLKDLDPPYIVFWHFSHFLVVEGFDKNKVHLSDPASGRRVVSYQEFDDGYTGVVLLIKPGANFQKGGEKPNIFKSLYSRLQNSLDVIFACFLVGLFLTVPRLAIPVFSAQFIDEVLINNRENWLKPILWGIAVAIVLIFLLLEVQLRYLRRLKIKLGVTMSTQFFWHLLRLPIEFYAQRFAGEISNRTQLNDQVANTLSGPLATNMIGLITMVVYGIVMLTYNVNLTLIVTVFAAINFLALQWISRSRIDANQSLIQDYGKVAGVEMSGLQSMETLKASGLESDFFSKWAGYYAKANNSQQKLGTQTVVLGLLPPFLSNIANMAVLTIGGISVIKGNLTLGGFVAFQQLMQQFLAPVNGLVDLGQQIQQLVGNVNRLDDVLGNPTDPQLATEENFDTEQVPSSFKLRGYIELKNLNFGYSPITPPIIADFHLSVKPGQRVALVGGSGSGKSTLAKIIAGLYQPSNGQLLFDGKPSFEYPRLVLNNSLAMVEQEIFLFSGTVRENLTLWNNTIDDEDLIQACKDAAIHDVVVALPQGYDSQLQEGGGNLSGGQRQRLEIARALVINPSILIMDEATSALDAETERIIDQNLRRRGCSCIIVAHRLSTIRDCDEIIVLDRGKVLQRGDHEKLWQEQGYYADLIRSESGG